MGAKGTKGCSEKIQHAPLSNQALGYGDTVLYKPK